MSLDGLEIKFNPSLTFEKSKEALLAVKIMENVKCKMKIISMSYLVLKWCSNTALTIEKKAYL